jgi:tRNA 2-thiouridine synthesizing protein A
MVDMPTPDRTLDTKGLLCPMPIVRLSKAMKELAPMQVILMEATDPGAIPDVAAWSKNTGNPILAQETVDKVMRFWIQKS